MPIGGGVSGAGNPVGGSNPAGTSGGLNFIVDHAYGYAGQKTAVSGTDAVLFDFSTGNYYVVGEFQMPFDKTGLANGESVGYTIKVNGEIIARCEQEFLTAGAVADYVMFPVPLLLPPNSHIEVLADTDQASDWVTTGIIIGRVYVDA